MNRLSVIAGVVLLGVIAGAGLAQAAPPGPPPDIRVSLALDKTSYGPGEPIMVTVALENLGAEEITTAGFSDTEFYLLLQFFDENGAVITSDQLGAASTVTPAPPRVFVGDTGALLQGELVEIVPQGWVVSYDPFDANEYYPLGNTSGQLRVKVVVPMRTYASYLQTASGVKYAQLYPTDAADWWGSLQSNFASFTRVGDADGDGYYYPQAYGSTTGVDCDDKNAAVNPGAAEILNNGIDDDCNPQTPDEGAAVVGGTIAVTVKKYTTYKGGPKEPLAGMELRAYDRTAGSCAGDIGLSYRKYSRIWEQCSADGSGTTDDDGRADLSVPPGEYLLIGRCETEICGTEKFIGSRVEPVAEGETVEEYLQTRVKATTGTIAVTVVKHSTGKGGSKEPLAGVELRAYDRTADSCARGIGVSYKKYPTIWEQCSADGSGDTDAEGKVDLSVAPGEYLLIGRCPAGVCEKETFVGGGADPVEAGQTVIKNLQIIVSKKKK